MRNYSLDEIIKHRNSVRCFTDKNISKDIIFEILQIASKAPSGNNIQPWNIYVVGGRKRKEIIKSVGKVYDEIVKNPDLAYKYKEEFDYYPKKWFSPYIERRRTNGWGLYNLLGISKGQKHKMEIQEKKNYEFFGAPIGLFFTVHKELGIGSKMDIAMFMQNIMLLAKSRGLDTCPQAAWNRFHNIVLPLIGACDQETLVATIALGYIDDTALINTFQTIRENVNVFTKWLDV